MNKYVKIKSEPVLSFDNQSTGPSSSLTLLTITEVSQLLHVSKSSVRRLQEARHLPFIKVGGSVRFTYEDVLAFIAQKRVGPVGNK